MARKREQKQEQAFEPVQGELAVDLMMAARDLVAIIIHRLEDAVDNDAAVKAKLLNCALTAITVGAHAGYRGREWFKLMGLLDIDPDGLLKVLSGAAQEHIGPAGMDPQMIVAVYRDVIREVTSAARA